MESTRPERPLVVEARLGLRGTAAVLAFLVFLGAIAVILGHRLAHSAMVDLGPTDETYVQGFRDIERDGPTYFRWSSVPSSIVSVPLRVCGPGTLRLRVRRHFVDPAMLSVSLGGSVLGQRSVVARKDHPYEVIEFRYLIGSCNSDTRVLLETTVENQRPLGVAVDWVEVNSPGGFAAAPATILRGAIFIGLAGLMISLAGGGAGLTVASGGILAVLVAAIFGSQPVAAERFLRGSLVALTLTATLGLLIVRLTGLNRMLLRQRATLAGLVLLTLLSRGAFFDNQAFYPDYRVHALVQQTLDRLGVASFLDQLFEVQYARSLGLQQVSGNWYPFPYPPGAYLLTSGVARLSGLAPLDAALVTAVTFASLIPLLTVALGAALGLGESVGLAGAFYVALQPLLIRRMALGYFPGLAGQFMDAVALLLVITALRPGEGELRRTALAILALLAAFLVYTQSIANFGLLIGGLLLTQLSRPTPAGRRGVLRVAVAGVIALVAAFGAFYWRYVPVFENAASHRPQPESRVLDRLEELRRNAPLESAVADADELNDPWTGPTFNPARGLGRLAFRLWRFNGPFVLAIAIGAWMLLRQTAGASRHLLVSWGVVALWISLLAAGLPSPNGFQHLKDLEFVSPLVALAIGRMTIRLWGWRPIAGSLLAAGWMIYAVLAFRQEWSDRLLALLDR